MLKDLAGARAAFEAAAKAAPDNPDFAYALGETCEQMGDCRRAIEAYLAAASAPYQENPAPSEAYERLFIAMRLGSKQDAEQKLAGRVAERIRRTTNDYTPLAMNRPAP